MDQAGLLTTAEVATLTDEALMTVHRKIQRGEYSAVAVASPHGQGGKQYMVDITNLPESVQMRYIAQMEGVGEADIVSYQQRYGDIGISAVLSRRNAVLECKIIERDGQGNITVRKNALAARIGVTLRTIYRWRDAYMIIVHSGEPRTPEQLRDEIEVLSAELYNAELRLANLQKSEQFRKKEQLQLS